MNKRGMFLEEKTTEIILAVMGLVVLFLLLGSIYFAFYSDEDYAYAKATTSAIVKEIKDMESGETRMIKMYNPEGWELVSFPIESNSPRKCLNEGNGECLCVCNLDFNTITLSGIIEDCSHDGFCENIENVKIVNSNSYIEINEPFYELQVKKTEEGILII